LKITNNADKINPHPILNIIIQKIGYSNNRNLNENAIPSTATNIRKIINVKPKLISDATFLESRNIYFGRLIFVMIPAFDIRELIPPYVESRKNEYVRFPANR
jgi:hypothetical protein